MMSFYLDGESHGFADELRFLPLKVHATIAGQEVFTRDILQQRVLGFRGERGLRHRREGHKSRDRHRHHQHPSLKFAFGRCNLLV